MIQGLKESQLTFDCRLFDKKHIVRKHKKAFCQRNFGQAFAYFQQFFCAERFFFVIDGFKSEYDDSKPILGEYLHNIDDLQKDFNRKGF